MIELCDRYTYEMYVPLFGNDLKIVFTRDV